MKVTQKLSWLALGLLIAVALLTGCNVAMVTGSGDVVERAFDYSDFTEVDISNAFQGTITQGDTYQVRVSIDDNLEQYLEVKKSGDRLSIGFKNLVGLTRATLEYEITMPTLTYVNVSGASQATLSGFSTGDAFRAEASGASHVAGELTSGDLNANASGASGITLTGTGGAVRAEASGASSVDLGDFTAESADVHASGASNITINTGGTLDGEASGASNIYYVGSPTLGNIDTSGASNIQAR